MQPVNIINGSWKQGVEPKVVNLTGTAFMEEAGAHVFHITAEDASGAAMAFTGTVSALFLRADNTTVAIDGEISGGAAEVTLVSDCYHAPGRFSIAIYVSDGTDSACVYAAVGNVYRTSSDVVIDSGATIPTLAQLQGAYANCVTAAGNATSAAAAAVGNFAVAFAEGTANAPGTYVTYSDGKMYYLPEGHTANATWANTTKNAVTVGEECSYLKGAIFESVTTNIPCSIVPAPDTASLTLTNYSGKKVFVSNRNLLPQFPELTDHGITFTHNTDGSISLSGTANGSATIRLSLNVMPNLTNGTFKLIAGNGNVTIGDDITYINVSINNSWSATVSARLDRPNSSCVFTLSENDVLDGIRIRISSGVVIPSGYTIYPMIVEYGQDETFVAHAGTVLSPSESENDITVYPDYTYICAQSGVTGTVTYKKSEIDGLNNDIANLDARVTVLEQKASKLAGKKIVCFGDSITGNYQPPADYPSMIAEITGATVYNMGFGGCCMAEVSTETRKMFSMAALADAINSGDYSAQVNSGVSITYGGTSIDYVPIRLEVLTNMDWSTVDYITIAYGTNDWNSNFLPENENDPFDKTKYIGAFRYSVEKILSKYPNIKILVITPLWRFWDSNTGMPSGIPGDYIDSNDYAKGTGYKLWQYGDTLVEAAHDMQIPVFDIYHACMMNKYNRHHYFNTNDGTHPKYAGIKMIAEMIIAHMESVY